MQPQLAEDAIITQSVNRLTSISKNSSSVSFFYPFFMMGYHAHYHYFN